MGLSKENEFVKSLSELLKKHGYNGKCNTSPEMLAEYIKSCMDAYIETVNKRDYAKGYGPTWNK